MKRTIKISQPLTTDKQDIELMKQVFMTWARTLFNQGLITFEECNKAIAEYSKIK